MSGSYKSTPSAESKNICYIKKLFFNQKSRKLRKISYYNMYYVKIPRSFREILNILLIKIL